MDTGTGSRTQFEPPVSHSAPHTGTSFFPPPNDLQHGRCREGCEEEGNRGETSGGAEEGGASRWERPTTPARSDAFSRSHAPDVVFYSSASSSFATSPARVCFHRPLRAGSAFPRSRYPIVAHAPDPPFRSKKRRSLGNTGASRVMDAASCRSSAFGTAARSAQTTTHARCATNDGTAAREASRTGTRSRSYRSTRPRTISWFTKPAGLSPW